MSYILVSMEIEPREFDLERFETLLVLMNFNRYSVQCEEERILLNFYFSNEDEMERILSTLKDELKLETGKLNVSRIDERDWMKKIKDYYQDFEILPGIWIEYVEEPSKKRRYKNSILLIPGSAFGTGTHPTTKISARLIYKYHFDGMDFLDLGCGTGILSIIAHRLGAKSITAVDVDELAVEKAKETFEINGVKGRIMLSDLFEHVDGKYDVIVANMDTENVLRVLKNAKDFLKDDGILIVSGIPIEKREKIMESASKNSFILVGKDEEKGWCGFAFKE